MKISHIGYLVKKIDRAAKAFLDLGYVIKQDMVRDTYRMVDILFLEKNGYLIELVSPYDRQSVVAGLISRTGNSPYHICYEVDSIDEMIDKLRDQRFVVSGDTASAPACGDRRVCFLVHPYMGLIELEENNKACKI